MTALGRLAQMLGLDPFEYLIIAIAGIVTWVWCTAVSDVALTGRGIWLRWGALAATFLGAVMFAYTARLLP